MLHGSVLEDAILSTAKLVTTRVLSCQGGARAFDSSSTLQKIQSIS